MMAVLAAGGYGGGSTDRTLVSDFFGFLYVVSRSGSFLGSVILNCALVIYTYGSSYFE